MAEVGPAPATSLGTRRMSTGRHPVRHHETSGHSRTDDVLQEARAGFSLLRRTLRERIVEAPSLSIHAFMRKRIRGAASLCPSSYSPPRIPRRARLFAHVGTMGPRAPVRVTPGRTYGGRTTCHERRYDVRFASGEVQRTRAVSIVR